MGVICKKIAIDEVLRGELAIAVNQAQLTSSYYDEVFQDGTAKPRPAPEAIRSLEDPDQRARADALWHFISRLESLLSQWSEWLVGAPLDGRSDPSLAFSLANGVKDCVRFLCDQGLFEEPEGQVIEAFPDPQQAPIGTRWYLWPEGAEWMHQSVERLRGLQSLRDRLRGCIRILETKPEALFVVLRPPPSAVTDAGQKASGVPTDPVEQAAQLIFYSPESIRLIRALSKRVDHKAHLDELAIELDNARKVSAKRRRGTIRQRFNRARTALEKEGAPVYLTIANNEVQLVIPDTPPDRAT